MKYSTLWKTFLSISFLLSSTLRASDQELSLKELVEYALENSPAYSSAANNLSLSKLNRDNALASFFPSLDLATTQGYQESYPDNLDENLSSQLRLSLSGNLYNNGTNFINYDRAKLDYKRNRVELERSRANLCLSIIREYNNYLFVTQSLNIQQSQYRLLKKQFSSVRELYQQGQKKRIDFIRFKARLQRANLSSKQAKIIQKQSLEEIKRIIAWKEDSLKIEKPIYKPIKLDLIPKEKIVFEDHYESRVARYQREVNDFSIQLEKRRYWPEVSLNSDLTYTNTNYLKGIDTFSAPNPTQFSAFLNINFNIWDWGTRKRNIKISQLNTMNSNNAISEGLLSLKAQLNNLMLNIGQEKENYLLNLELMKLEEKNFKKIKQSYRNGKATFLDLINSLDNYTSAKESYFRNFYQLKSSIASYYFHEGSLYEKTLQD